MYRIIMCAVVGAFFIGSQAVAQNGNPTITGLETMFLPGISRAPSIAIAADWLVNCPNEGFGATESTIPMIETPQSNGKFQGQPITLPASLSSRYSGALSASLPSPLLPYPDCVLVGSPNIDSIAVSASATAEVTNQANSTVLSMSGGASLQGNGAGFAPSGASISFALPASAQYTLVANLSLSGSRASTVSLVLCGPNGCVTISAAHIDINGTFIVDTAPFPSVSQTGMLDAGGYFMYVAAGVELIRPDESASANFSVTLTLGSASSTNVVSWKQFNEPTTNSTWGTNPYDNSYRTTETYPTKNTPVSAITGKFTLTDGTNSCQISSGGATFPNTLAGLGSYVRNVCPGVNAGQPMQDKQNGNWYQSLYDTRCMLNPCPRPNTVNTGLLQLTDFNNLIQYLRPKIMSAEGCDLTCLAMALQSAGVPNNIPGSNPPIGIDPGTLNNFTSNAASSGPSPLIPTYPAGSFNNQGDVRLDDTVNAVQYATDRPRPFEKEDFRSTDEIYWISICGLVFLLLWGAIVQMKI